MSDESDFLKRNPEARRWLECDSATTRAYVTNSYLWLFDKHDGHLAWKCERETHQTVYECECIKRGRAECIKRGRVRARLFGEDPDFVEEVKKSDYGETL